MRAALRNAVGPLVGRALWPALLLCAALPGCKAGLGTPCSDAAPCAAGQQCTGGVCALCDPASPPQPTLTCAQDRTLECTGGGSATSTLTFTEQAGCNLPEITDTLGPTVFALGTTSVPFSAKDGASAPASCTTIVTVVDTTPPTLACPALITAECTGNGGARVNPGQATASDACGPVTFVYKPVAGDFPLGTTEVATAVKDLGGNTATCTQTIKVVDTTPPAITCPAPIAVECTGNGKARINPGRATATDACSSTTTIVNAAQGDYPLGVTQASYSATDPAGNTATCSQTVTVQDTQPPVVTSGQANTPAKTIPAGAEQATIDLLADCRLSVADTCDGAITPTSTNTSAGCVTVSEGAARPGGPDVVFVDATHVKVWPAQTGSARRFYRIPVTVKDATGNAGNAICTIAIGLGLGSDPGTVAQTICPAAAQPVCTPQTCKAYVYAAGDANGLYGFSLDQSTGALTELAGSPFPYKSSRLAAHPKRGMLYATDEVFVDQLVGAFAVAHDGSLSQVGTWLPTGNSPETITVNPAGTFAYVGNVYGGGTGIYPIDPATGGLGAGTSLSSDQYNHGGVFDPTGRWFYLSRNNYNDVTRYLADSTTGALTSGVTLPAAGGYHEAMDPQGRYLYVSDWDKSGAKLLSAYAIGSDGTLTLVGDYDTGGGNPAGVAVTPDGRFVYTVNWGSLTISGFSVGAGGVLSALSGSPFALGDGSWELSIDPTGKWLFAGHGAVISTFTIDGSSGALTLLGKPLTGSGTSPTLGASVVVLVP